MSAPLAVLITGCSSGIGRATALEAASRGHRVYATARDRAGLEELAGLSGLGALPLDVTDLESIRQAVEVASARTGRIDALVNNAGYAQYGAAEDVTPEEWRRQFDVNFFGAIEVTRAVLPAMRKARGGTIVNVSSVAGKISIPFSAPYCSSKHALEGFSDALRVEVAPFGIRVVVVEPGPVSTRYMDRARAGVARMLSAPGPYSAFYANAERAMETDFQAGSLPPEAVARVIVNAIESPRPKTRYRVGSMAKLFLPLRRLLSDRSFDRKMKKSLKLPDRV
ncbi:MAG TPA: SDR family oxidoreductase [Thermoanaerobaculia bacterium]|nr:SDR family oxidoreductase [Thermoanaerobaculia bacterium]